MQLEGGIGTGECAIVVLGERFANRPYDCLLGPGLSVNTLSLANLLCDGAGDRWSPLWVLNNPRCSVCVSAYNTCFHALDSPISGKSAEFFSVHLHS